jgi:hypothetical protein
MGIKLFPTNFVYWEPIGNHDKIKPILIDKILKNDKKYENNKASLENAHTSYSQNEFGNKNFTPPEFYTDLVWNPVKNLIRKLSSLEMINESDISELMLDKDWYTKYDDNGSMGLHAHIKEQPTYYNNKLYSSFVSLIYILHDENERNSTCFKVIPGFPPLSMGPQKEIMYDTSCNSEIKEGVVIAFPSSLLHEVVPVKIPGRITIAFNVMCNFSDL